MHIVRAVGTGVCATCTHIHVDFSEGGGRSRSILAVIHALFSSSNPILLCIIVLVVCYSTAVVDCIPRSCLCG